MPKQAKSASIDEYIAQFPHDTQAVLQELRALIKSAAPAAIEVISYGMPTFDLNGRHLVHFSGWKEHIGFYPVPVGVKSFEKALAPYVSGKGTARFPLDEPLPKDLIRRLVEWRVRDLTR